MVALFQVPGEHDRSGVVQPFAVAMVQIERFEFAAIDRILQHTGVGTSQHVRSGGGAGKAKC